MNMTTSSSNSFCDRSSICIQNNRDWKASYHAITDCPPRSTLLKALQHFKTPGFAVDLGCGEGRDSVELLRRGWQVVAVDAQREGIDRLRRRPEAKIAPLETRITRIETYQFPQNIDLINASFSLPFCHPKEFLKLWRKMVAALPSGGYFCGHLFGNRDSWVANPLLSGKPWITYQTRSQVEKLLHPFTLKYLEEEEYLSNTPLREERHWHIFHIVAQKL
jgi:tellurite methyltransferase